jgi:hypothetical protein
MLAKISRVGQAENVPNLIDVWRRSTWLSATLNDGDIGRRKKYAMHGERGTTHAARAVCRPTGHSLCINLALKSVQRIPTEIRRTADILAGLYFVYSRKREETRPWISWVTSPDCHDDDPHDSAVNARNGK